MNNFIIEFNTDPRPAIQPDISQSRIDCKSEESKQSLSSDSDSIDGFDLPWSSCSFTNILIEPNFDNDHVRLLELEALKNEMVSIKLALCTFMSDLKKDHEVLQTSKFDFEEFVCNQVNNS